MSLSETDPNNDTSFTTNPSNEGPNDKLSSNFDLGSEVQSEIVNEDLSNNYPQSPSPTLSASSSSECSNSCQSPSILSPNRSPNNHSHFSLSCQFEDISNSSQNNNHSCIVDRPHFDNIEPPSEDSLHYSDNHSFPTSTTSCPVYNDNVVSSIATACLENSETIVQNPTLDKYAVVTCSSQFRPFDPILSAECSSTTTIDSSFSPLKKKLCLRISGKPMLEKSFLVYSPLKEHISNDKDVTSDTNFDSSSSEALDEQESRKRKAKSKHKKSDRQKSKHSLKGTCFPLEETINTLSNIERLEDKASRKEKETNTTQDSLGDGTSFSDSVIQEAGVSEHSISASHSSNLFLKSLPQLSSNSRSNSPKSSADYKGGIDETWNPLSKFPALIPKVSPVNTTIVSPIEENKQTDSNPWTEDKKLTSTNEYIKTPSPEDYTRKSPPKYFDVINSLASSSLAPIPSTSGIQAAAVDEKVCKKEETGESLSRPVVIDSGDEDSDEKPLKKGSPEVVEVDDGPPCVVDLTEEDDLEVVSPDSPAVVVSIKAMGLLNKSHPGVFQRLTLPLFRTF